MDALRREIKEETNLDVTDIEFVLVQDCIHSKEFYRDAHFVLLNYTCRCAGQKPRVKLNDEGTRIPLGQNGRGVENAAQHADENFARSRSGKAESKKRKAKTKSCARRQIGNRKSQIVNP